MKLHKLCWGFLVLGAIGCSGRSTDSGRVVPKYDEKSGKLSQMTVDAAKDGKPNIFSYMDGAKFVRIEIDNDEDGQIDRWEYYTPDQKIEKVGLSRANDGKQDSWAYQGSDGVVSKIEVSTHHNGKVDRVEFYQKGLIATAEVVGDGDGRPDKWETYQDGVLIKAAFDTQHSGAPDTVIDYRNKP
jgi:hypothetical protein